MTWFKRCLVLSCVLSVLAVGYYFAIARLPLEILSEQQILAQYDYKNSFAEFRLETQTQESLEFSFMAHDEQRVYGKLMLPSKPSANGKYPVLVGAHAMGRSYPRWFQSSLKGRPTVTHVNKITEQALAKGYAVVAIDARYHGKRKVKDKPLSQIWNNLHYFGNKQDYQDMLVNTVIDHRLLLDWLETQAELDMQRVSVAGYSMGGQVALLLAAVDKRVKDVVAIVPPYLDDKVATAAPKNLVHRLKSNRTLLLTGAYDDVASDAENLELFNRISTNEKQHIEFDADHLLPESYVNVVRDWLP